MKSKATSFKLSSLLGTGSAQFLGKPLALLASIKDNIGLGGRYWRWGEQDNFPNTIIDSANDSGTARDCIDKLHTFIVGNGIKDKEFFKKQANPAQTWEQLDDEVSQQMAYIPAVCVRVLFNAGGDIARVYNMPIQNVRRRHDGQFIYGEELGDPQGFKMYQSWKREVIPAFGTHATPRERREMIAKQKAEYGRQVGELLYIFTPGVGLNYKYYPVPKWSAGLHDINADAALSLHEESQVSNSFKGTVVIETRPLDRKNFDENKETEADRFEAMIQDASRPDGGSVIHLETLGTDGTGSKITPLNIQHQMDATEKATDRVGRKVCRLFGVPPVLLGFATAGKLGDNQELVNYMALFNLTLDKKWKLKKRMYLALFPEMPPESFDVEPLQLFNHIPDKVLEKLDIKVLSKMYNIDAVHEEIEQEEAPVKREVNEHLKTLTGKQQQQLDRIVRKFGKDELTQEQAVLQLMTGFGFTNEEALTYLNISSDGNGVN